jgi:glycosyltransferase involved in cell wall biosynthesis
MALAKPVVANDQPDQRKLLEESGAGICTPYDAGLFGKALIRLLDHPEEAREMGVKGRGYVQRARTYGAIADTLEAHYARLVK